MDSGCFSGEYTRLACSLRRLATVLLKGESFDVKLASSPGVQPVLGWRE